MKKNLFLSLVVLLIPLLFFPNYLFAVGSAGFENASYSARTLGQGNAVVARPQDPSTLLFNPAGLVDLPGVQVSAGLQSIDWRTYFKSSVNGNKQHNVPKLILLPSFYASVNPGEIL